MFYPPHCIGSFLVKINILLIQIDVMYIIKLCWTVFKHNMHLIYKLSFLSQVARYEIVENS